MDPREYRDLAMELANGEAGTAAELRTAVSRAYYAAFNVAVSFLGHTGVKHQGGWEAHRLIPEAIRFGRDEKVAAAARELDDIRKARWSADYDMEDVAVEDQRTVQKWVARAKQIIRKLDECEADPERLLHARIEIRKWAGSADGAGKGFLLT